MKANNLPVLGAKVIVNAIMRRGWAPSEHQLFEVCRKKWRKIPLGKPLAGIFVGARIAWDGYTENRGEDGMSFIPTGHQMVYLVAVSRTRMVRALPEDVRLEDSGVRG